MLLCEIFKKQLWKYLKYNCSTSTLSTHPSTHHLWQLTPDNWPLFQTSVFDQTYLLTPRLLQTSYVNAIILESRSIIISSFNFKELWEILEFRTSELSQTTPLPPSGNVRNFKTTPPPHLPDVLCRRSLTSNFILYIGGGKRVTGNARSRIYTSIFK